jgi:hypothetical protein
LKIALDGGINQSDVIMHGMIQKNDSWNRKELCYSHLERDGIYLFSDKFYKHRDWDRVMDEGYVIPDVDWYDVTQWEYQSGIKFWVTLKD